MMGFELKELKMEALLSWQRLWGVLLDCVWKVTVKNYIDKMPNYTF
jgi:hypothetical protein